MKVSSGLILSNIPLQPLFGALLLSRLLQNGVCPGLVRPTFSALYFYKMANISP